MSLDLAARFVQARNALERINELCRSFSLDGDDASIGLSIAQIRRITAKALETPCRNCDLGDATSQQRRWLSFCEAWMVKGGCAKCPICKGGICNKFEWGQMSVEESQGNKGEKKK